mgnify:CR=1 FL=1
MSRRPDKIVMATGNPGKIREIARLLDGLGIEVIAQSEFGVSDAKRIAATSPSRAMTWRLATRRLRCVLPASDRELGGG